MTTYELKHRIFIRHNTTPDATDSNGNPDPTWVLFIDTAVWAAKKGLRGRTFYEAAASQSEDNIVFVIRYNSVRATITTDMQIVEGTSIYEITAPPVDAGDKKQWLEIHAKKVVINGS